MKTHADKVQLKSLAVVADNYSGKRSCTQPTCFVDSRPEALAQSRLQEMANISPQVMRLKSLQEIANHSPQVDRLAQLDGIGKSTHETGIVQRFTDEEMEKFYNGQIDQRKKELQGLNQGFISQRGFQPGPVFRGALGLMQSRFDLSEVGEEHRDDVEYALSGGTKSLSQNLLVAGVGMDLFGRMLRNVGRLNNDNFVRDLANMSGNPYSKPFHHKTDPTKAIGAEDAKLHVVTNRGSSPYYDYKSNTVSLMNPEQMDQTAHELQHARDHLHGDLDLKNPNHRLASELNAFTRQDIVANQSTGSAPSIFKGKNPTEMAETYEGKEAKGYKGTLEESLEEARRWREANRKT